MIGLRSRRVGITSTVLLVILALLLTWLATRAEGETLRKAELNDGGVWVTTSAQSRFGRINKPAGQLDAAVAATSPDNTGLDIVQDGAAVVGIVKATNQATPINVRTGILQESSVLTLPTPVPGQPGGVSGTIDVRGGTIATIDPATGKLRVQRVDSATGVTTLDKLASTAPPVATIGAGATVAVAVDGTVYAVSASSGQLAVVSPLPTGGFADANVRELGFTANSAQLTVVGDRWVIFDPSTGLVRADGLSAPVDITARLGLTGGGSKGTAYSAVVQQPGPDADTVAIAGPRGLTHVVLRGDLPPGGDVVLPGAAASATLIPAAPVRLGRCVHSAWASEGQTYYGRSCTDAAVDAVALDTRGTGARVDGVRLRVNRGLIVLNDLDSGAVFDVDSDKPVKIDDWTSVIPPPRSGNDNTKPDPNQLDDQVVKKPPEAKPDDLVVRPGRTSTLHVLDNDTDSLGAVLAIAPGDVTTPDVPGILVSPSVDGQTVSISVPDKPAANVVRFSYGVNNGNAGPEGRSTALVTVTIVDDSVNTAPYVRQGQAVITSTKTPVVAGGHVSVGVLADWRDAESDPVVVEALDPSSSVDGAGALAITAPNQKGLFDVKYRVDDGRGGRTEAKVTVTVLDDTDRAVAPVAQADVVRAVVGKPVQVQPLGNDIPGADPSDPTARMRLAADVRGPTGLMIDTNLETGVVTVTGAAPGSHLLTYAAQVGSGVGAGRFRVDILPPPTDDAPPVAAPDAVTVRDQAPAVTDVLVNDYSPRSDVLVIQSVVTTESWVRAWVIQGRWLRVQSTAPLTAGATERRGVVVYTISDGTRTAAGEVSVVQKAAPPAAVMPNVVDDQAVVRWGDVVSIPVLDNDSMADGVPLKLTPSTVKVVAGKGQVYPSGQVLRYRPDPAAITADTVATLEYAAYPEGMPERSVTGRVTVTVKPLPTPQTPNQPPTARSFAASVTAGEALTLTVPTSGIDPDGDLTYVSGIVGEAGGPVNLRLGRVTGFGGSTIRYEAYPTSSGTEVLRYAVTDRFGKSGEGLVRLGVVQPGAPQPPVAVPDDIVAAPGRTVTIDAIANDLIPRNSDVTVEDPALINDPAAVAAFVREGDTSFKVKVPDEGQPSVLVYGITGGLFDPSRATITVRGNKNFNNPPVAVDDVARVDIAAAGAAGVDGAPAGPGAPGAAGEPGAPAPTSVLVDVLGNDKDLETERSALKVIEVGDGATIERDGVRVTFADYPRAVPYIVEDGDGGRAMAVIYVPANGSDLPYAVPGKTVVMDQNATLSIRLGDYVADPRNRAVSVTTPDTVSASPAGLLTVTVTSPTELSLTASGGYLGPAAIMLEVTDSTGPDDVAPRTAYVVVPVQVGPLRPLLRCPQWEVTVIAEGQPRLVDIPRLCSAWFPEGLDPNSVTYRAEWDQAADKVSLTRKGTGGRQVELVAAADAVHGTRGTASIGVEGQDQKFPLQVRVISLRVNPAAAAAPDAPPPPPPAVVRPARVEGLIAGQTQTVNMAQYLDSPFGSLHCEITGVRVSGGSGAGVSGAPRHCLLDVTASRDATGAVVLAVEVSDGPDRVATGTVTVTVLSRPNPPQSVDAVADRILGGTARVSWLPPSYDGGLPVLEYEVGWAGGAQRCSASPCTVGGLTNGVAYRFTVRARNAADWSDPGGPSPDAIPDRTPEAVTITGTSPGDRSMGVSWIPPVNDGSRIDIYRVQVVSLSAGSGGGAFDTAGGSTATTVSGLVNNDQYEYRVQAHNDAGWGPLGPAVRAQSVGTPDPVGKPSVVPPTPTPGDDVGLLRVSWPDTNPNGPPIVGYAVWRQIVGGSTTLIGNVSAGQSNSVSDSLVYDGSEVQYYVIATNGGGKDSPPSPLSDRVRLVGSPDQPRPPAVDTPAANMDVAASWSLGRSRASRWTTVEWRTSAGKSGSESCSGDCSFSGTLVLDSIVVQTLSIRGCTDAGTCSEWSAASSAFQPFGPTLPVVMGQVTPKKQGSTYDVTFTWQIRENGRAVGVAVTSTGGTCAVEASNTGCTINNVPYDTPLSVTVTTSSLDDKGKPVTAAGTATASANYRTPAKVPATITLTPSTQTCVVPDCTQKTRTAYVSPAGKTCRYVQLASANWDAATMRCTVKTSVGEVLGTEDFTTNTTVVGSTFYGETGTLTATCTNSTTGEQATDNGSWP